MAVKFGEDPKGKYRLISIEEIGVHQLDSLQSKGYIPSNIIESTSDIDNILWDNNSFLTWDMIPSENTVLTQSNDKVFVRISRFWL